MCHLEDVYHVPCGHWADKPNIRHHCVKMRDQSDHNDYAYDEYGNSTHSSNTSTYYYSSSSSSPRYTQSAYRTAIPCHDAEKSRSRTEHHQKCPRCIVDVDKIVSKQSGMWFSCYFDAVTGKTRYKNRDGESQASRAARFGLSSKKSTKDRPGQSKKGCQMAGMEGMEEEEKTSRNNSWSSHGHVEL